MAKVTKPNNLQVNELYHTKFVKLYDLTYDEGAHYFEASRRDAADVLADKGDDVLTTALPDAVSACFVVVTPNDEPRQVLFYEYRYPTGQYLLSIPSGLIDARDGGEDDPCAAAMIREIAEETGIVVGEDDRVTTISPFLFNTPGLTDESTALLCVVVHLDDLSLLSHAGAEGSERFGDFELLTAAEVRQILAQGRDPRGHFYPMVAWAAMTYFASGIWHEGF